MASQTWFLVLSSFCLFNAQELVNDGLNEGFDGGVDLRVDRLIHNSLNAFLYETLSMMNNENV